MIGASAGFHLAVGGLRGKLVGNWLLAAVDRGLPRARGAVESRSSPNCSVTRELPSD